MNQSQQAAAENPWREAVNEALIACGLDCLGDAESPAESISRLVKWHVNVALDPAVSARAQALVDQGAALASSPQPADPMDAEAYAELFRLREEVKGPDGFATWHEAAVDERIRRVRAEKSLAEALASPPSAPAEVPWTMPADSQEMFSLVNKTPLLQSLLYDLNLLPEQIRTTKHWFYFQSICAHFKMAASPSAPAQVPAEVTALRSALNAMLTHFGMDEDEWTKPTFDQARAALELSAASANAARDEAFEAVRRVFCKLPRFSFLLDQKGNVCRVPAHTGNWVEFQAAHELFDPVAVDAALSASPPPPVSAPTVGKESAK